MPQLGWLDACLRLVIWWVTGEVAPPGSGAAAPSSGHDVAFLVGGVVQVLVSYLGCVDGDVVDVEDVRGVGVVIAAALAQI